MSPPSRFAAIRRIVPLTLAVAMATAGVAAVATPAMAAPDTPRFTRAIDDYATYDPQRTCDPTPKPGVVDFRDLLKKEYHRGDSGIGRACNLGGTSEHKEGRALDYPFNVNNDDQRDDATELLRWLLKKDEYGHKHALARRLGIMYIIWNRQIWEAYRPNEGWQEYNGPNPHTDHIHFSFSWRGARKQTTWWTGRIPPDVDKGAVELASGDVSVVRAKGNVLAAYRLGADGWIHGAGQRRVGQAFGPWKRIGDHGAFAGRPSAIVATNLTIGLYARGTNGKIYGVGQENPGSDFGEWNVMGLEGPARFASDPTVIRADNGAIAIYATDTDGWVWGTGQARIGSTFGKWTRLGTHGGFTGRPTAVIASNDTIGLYARGTGNKIYGIGQERPGSAFGDWSVMGLGGPVGFVREPSVIRAANNTIALYAPGADGWIWGVGQQQVGGAFTEWKRIGLRGGFDSRPSVLKAPNGTIALYARDTDNNFYGVGQAEQGSVFGEWGLMGVDQPTCTGDASAAVSSEKTIVLYCVGSDGRVWGSGQEEVGEGFGNWYHVGT